MVRISIEAEAVKERLANLCGGRVYDGLTDDDELARHDNGGDVRPYIVLRFNEPIKSGRDRGIGGERSQPYIFSGSVECWGPDNQTVRLVGDEVRDLLLGWAPTENNDSEISLRGGGDFRYKDSAGRPSIRMWQVNWETVTNMSTEE